MPKPLAIIYSDLHLNIWPSFNKDNQRLINGLKAMNDISKKAKKLNVPILFLGDLFHKEEGLSNEILNQVLPEFGILFGDNSPKTFAITGNHDQSRQNSLDNPSPSYIRTLSRTFEHLYCIDNSTLELGEYLVHGIPYITNDTGLVEEIKRLGKMYKGDKNILLLHTTLPTARDTDERTIHSHLEENEFLKATKNFKLVLSGHIHKPEMIIKDFMYSIGAPQQQRATDRNCKMGYWILYDNLKMKFKELKGYPKFIYYRDESEIKDDGNFYLKKNRTRRDNKEISLNLKKEISSLNVNKIVKKYCKSKSVKDKAKVSALTKVLKDVI